MRAVVVAIDQSRLRGEGQFDPGPGHQAGRQPLRRARGRLSRRRGASVGGIGRAGRAAAEQRPDRRDEFRRLVPLQSDALDGGPIAEEASPRRQPQRRPVHLASPGVDVQIDQPPAPLLLFDANTGPLAVAGIACGSKDRPRPEGVDTPVEEDGVDLRGEALAGGVEDG